MEHQSSSQLLALQQMPEHEFTQRVMVPLLKALGYDPVDVHHGPDEGGKDLICWQHDELGDLALTVVQVKRFRLARRARSDKSFSEVVNQLAQCVETKVPFTDGKSYRPSAVYFVTPYVVDTRTLSTRFEKVASLRQHRVRIIDGVKLLGLLHGHVPQLAAELLGSRQHVGRVLTPHLSNQVLMSALGFAHTKHVSGFYTDLDIAVGTPSEISLFDVRFAPSSQRPTLGEEEWATLKGLAKLSRQHFSVDILGQTTDAVDKTMLKRRKKWAEWKTASRALASKASKLEQDARETQEKLCTLAIRSSDGPDESERMKQVTGALADVRSATRSPIAAQLLSGPANASPNSQS